MLVKAATGYKLIHQGFRCSKHGGLIAYVNEKYSYKLPDLYDKSDVWEGLFIDVNGDNLSSLGKSTHRHWIHINVCRVSCGGVVNMLLVLSITFYFHYNIWGCRCSTGPFQYRWLKGYIYSSCYYHHQIGSIHLSHCYHIFPWLCAWDVCYIIFCHLLHIRSGKTGNLFSLLVCSLWWVQMFGYVLACRSYSFVWTVHHLIIIIVQTYLKALNLQNACQDIFCRVCE